MQERPQISHLLAIMIWGEGGNSDSPSGIIDFFYFTSHINLKLLKCVCVFFVFKVSLFGSITFGKSMKTTTA